MVIAYHVVLSVYGFWLPNEQRGSWSNYVGASHLLPFGRATRVFTHRSVAKRDYDRDLRREMRAALKYKPVRFNGHQALCVARGFEEASRVTGCPIHACAIMPDHAHLVVPRHDYPVEQLIDILKAKATVHLKRARMHPFQDQPRPDGVLPKVWGRGGWAVFLESDADVRRAIRYTDGNPAEYRLPRQRWGFVNDWLSA